jgi:hypothetical protein
MSAVCTHFCRLIDWEMSDEVLNLGSKMFNKLFTANKTRADLDQNLWVKKNCWPFFLHITLLHLANLLSRVLVKNNTMSFGETCEFFRVDSVGVLQCVWKFKKALRVDLTRIIVVSTRTATVQLTTQRAKVTMRVEITLCVYKSHSFVSKSHSYGTKSHSACRNHSRACWNHSRECQNHILAGQSHNACRNYTQACHFHTRECHIYTYTFKITLVCVETTLCVYNHTLRVEIVLCV